MDNIPPLPPEAQPPAQPATLEAQPGGFWLRAGAYMIDGILIGVPGAILSAIVGVAGLPGGLGTMLGLALSAAYFTYMPVAYGGQTIGKMAAGLAVVRTDGSSLDYGRAAGRWVGYYISSLPAFLGFLTAVFTDKKRALHDFIADTRVVTIKEIGTFRKICVVSCGLLIPLAVVAGIAAALMIPKLSGLADQSKEGATKANLGAMRASLSIYYGDTEGNYPETPEVLTKDGRYLSGIPKASTPPHHPDSREIQIYGAEACAGESANPQAINDAGGWGYISSPDSACHGMLFVNCTHQDSKKTTWHTY